MNLKQVIFTLTTMFIVMTYGQFLGFQEEWVRHIGSDPIPHGINSTDNVPMAIDTSNNIIVARRINAGSSKSDVYIIKYNQDGDTLWTRRWKYIQGGIPDTLGEQADDVVTDGANNIYVLVSSNVVEGPISSMDLVILKYNQNGTLVDSVRFDEMGDTDEMMNQIILDPGSGDIYVCGRIKNYTVSMNDQWFVLKFDSNLDLVWKHSLLSMIGAQAKDMVLDGSGDLFVTGYTSNPGTNYDYLTIKYNPTTGVIQDSAQYSCPSPGGQLDMANCITIDNSNNVIISGNINTWWNTPMTMQDFYTIKYDNNLNTLWARQYDFITMLADGGGDIICDASSNVYVIGSVQLNSADTDVMAIKYSSNGDQLWTSRYSGPGYYPDAAGKLTFNSDETELYAVGHSSEVRTRQYNEWQRDYLVLILDPETGDTLQTLKYDGLLCYQDEAKDIVVDDAGNIYISGHTRESDSTYADITTIKYQRIVDDTPPESPYITQVTKSGTDVHITWGMVTLDTLGSPENMQRYDVYRSTAPDFIPSPVNYIGQTSHPGTTYTDAGAISQQNSYYYLIKAVDIAENSSSKSNMGYKFKKTFNMNAGPTSDKNWTSIPWHTTYTTVSELTTDLSPDGAPLNVITNLRDDQAFESWTYNFGWFGTDFPIVAGAGYEMSTVSDTSLFFLGANNPNGAVTLNENSGALSDKNWVSTPYNAVYTRVIDITDEYSPTGDPLIVLTNLRNDQLYENWIWDDVFSEWNGDTFDIERGRGYEFVTIVDTNWNPTEFTNASDRYRTKPISSSQTITTAGDKSYPERFPVWSFVKGEPRPCINHDHTVQPHRIAGTSHIVRLHLNNSAFTSIRFIAYRLDKPHDVITEALVGSGTAMNEEQCALWFNTGNFLTPWEHGEHILLLVEAYNADHHYIGVIECVLNENENIQDLGFLALAQMPIPEYHNNTVSWKPLLNNEHILGYSLYDGDKRINRQPITNNTHRSSHKKLKLRLVLTGGYETSPFTPDPVSATEENSPSFSIIAMPNPFFHSTKIVYALEKPEKVVVAVYDITGRQIAELVNAIRPAGTHEVFWQGIDMSGRHAADGIYIIRMTTEQSDYTYKLILTR